MKRLSIFWDKTFEDWRYRFLLHTGFWFFLLFFWMGESVTIQIYGQHGWTTLISAALALFLYYPLVYMILPQVQKRNYVFGTILFVLYYVLAVLLRDYVIQQITGAYNLTGAWVVGNDFFKRLYASEFNPLGILRVIFSSMSSLISIIYVPLTFKFVRYIYQFNLKQVWLARENAQLQLQTLKAQINPHFFFNTLNNLQSFIVQNEKEKSVVLLSQLADFMRTSLYDGEKELISMRKEIEMLSTYVAIERVRFEDEADIEFNFWNEDPDYMVPPFIFLPFVENAFKHGVAEMPENVRININLVNTPEMLKLETTNSCRMETSKGGIGLANVKKRLEYYFPGRHLLKGERTETSYSLNLEIEKL